MNLYMIVEGKKTETSVYPAWLSILAPNLQRVSDPRAITDNCYYLFSGEGIPSIYNHACNAILDIQQINKGYNKYDYFLICLDTEEGTREDINREFKEYLIKNKVNPQGVNVVICEHKVCMETWFLGNRDPELMPSFDSEKNKAEYHLYYLKKMFAERNMIYKKTKTDEVQDSQYLNQLISRYKETGQIATFGQWFDFITSNFK